MCMTAMLHSVLKASFQEPVGRKVACFIAATNTAFTHGAPRVSQYKNTKYLRNKIQGSVRKKPAPNPTKQNNKIKRK